MRQQREQNVLGSVRVLVAMEPRSYREVIGYAIQGLRPNIAVSVADPRMLAAEVARLGPEMVIYSSPGEPPAGITTWLEVPENPALPATLYQEGRRSELPEFDLPILLAVLDNAHLGTHQVA